MKPTLLAATVLGGLACSMPARATLIEYQFSLSIIAAAGGGTMTGDFDYDAVTNLESNVSITIAGNAFGSGSSLDVTYTPHPSPHSARARNLPNSPLPTSISANRCISGSSRCSGMFGISS